MKGVSAREVKHQFGLLIGASLWWSRSMGARWYFHCFGDNVTQQPETRRPRPGPRAIIEAQAALLWLRWLGPQDATLVWLRANRTAWKPICWELGISRATANRW